MNTWWKIGSYVIAIVAAIALVNWYGGKKFDEGYLQRGLEAQAAAAQLSEAYREQENNDRKKADDELAKHKAEKAATEAANFELGNLYSGLQRDVAAYKRRLSDAASNPGGAVKTGTAGIDNYQQCVERYSSMGSEYAEVADRLNGLIGQCQVGR